MKYLFQGLSIQIAIILTYCDVMWSWPFFLKNCLWFNNVNLLERMDRLTVAQADLNCKVYLLPVIHMVKGSKSLSLANQKMITK